MVKKSRYCGLLIGGNMSLVLTLSTLIEKARPLVWLENLETDSPVILQSENKLANYYIIPAPKGGDFYIYYGNGRANEFKTVEECKEWAERIHYPAKLEQFLTAHFSF